MSHWGKSSEGFQTSKMAVRGERIETRSIDDGGGGWEEKGKTKSRGQVGSFNKKGFGGGVGSPSVPKLEGGRVLVGNTIPKTASMTIKIIPKNWG